MGINLSDEVIAGLESRRDNKRWRSIGLAVKVLMEQINNNNLPQPYIDMQISERSYLMFNYVWPDLNIASDIIKVDTSSSDSGKNQKLVGRHNAAALLGWDVYLITPTMVYNGSAIDLISRAIKSKMELSHAAQG